MRPEILFPLFTLVSTLSGLGPKLAPLVEKLCGERVGDLLWLRPYALIDRRFSPKIKNAPDHIVCTMLLSVDQHLPPDSPKRPYRVRCSDETGFLHLVFFKPKQSWIEKTLPIGSRVCVSGLVEHFNNEIQISHPDHIVPPERISEIQTIEAVYPLTGGLPGKVLAKAVKAALSRAPDLPEWLDGPLKQQQHWPDWHPALLHLHAPQDLADLEPLTPHRRRLAYDELLANQLALALVRMQLRRRAGRCWTGEGTLRQRLRDSLPFSLTTAQEQAVAEIAADQAVPQRMLRLLQGDVGAGKTVVALFAMALVIEGGGQAALMAPTEILARQHLATLERFGSAVGLRIGLLTGRDKGKARQALLTRLESGEIDILVGTHALIQPDVVFRDLGLAVIDEQHRFGVQQRLDLAAKGKAVDMLVMSATPIPRTLLLAAHGDMDVSRLEGKPPGRQPITTRVLPLGRLDEVIAGVRRAISGGAKVFWVCPLVAESEKSDLAAAEARHLDLLDQLGPRVGLIHGRMKGAEKDAVMAGFAGEDFDLLVSTTVIEVGVDIPAATVMVIEHAERFGLAQVHQLRGRIGRGSGASTCLLLYGAPLSETARARLAILRDSEDGFLIAEEDFRLRGGGEVLGTRQSGLPEFRVAELPAHADLLTIASRDARMITEIDPDLTSPRGQALRTLLYLFGRDQVVPTLRAG